MKKRIALFLVLALIAAILGGCGSAASSTGAVGAASAETASATSASDSPEAAEPEAEAPEEEITAEEPESAEEPEVEEPEEPEENPLAESLAAAADYFPLDETATLTGWGTLIPPVLSITEDLNDFLAYQLSEKATNIHINWTSVSIIQANEAFQLMVASGEYPDLLKGAGNMMSGGVETAINEDVIIDLAEYLDEYAPNFQTVRMSNKDFEKGSATDSGYIGAFCYFASEEEACATKGGFVRQDWLDKLGLDVPVTVADYYEVMTAFHNEYGATYGLPSQGLHFNNAFESAYDISVPFASGAMNSGFFQIDGKAFYGPVQDGYKDYLKEMAKWYAEGLISSDFMSDPDSANSGTVADNLITNGNVGIFYGAATQYQNYEAESADPDFKLTALRALVLEDGQITHTRGLNGAVGPAISISTDCAQEDLENALRWCDWWYTEDGYVAANWGQEGLTFNYDENGEPVYTDIVLNNPDMNRDTSIIMYTMSEMGDHFQSDGRRIYQYYADGILDIKMLWSEGDDNAYVIPGDISKTADETATLYGIASEIYSYTIEMTLRFITGADDIEASWDNYVSTLESLGIQDAAEVYETAYARYLER